jgi:pimeloyl-ACP methyl ester carboxylesterase
MAQQRWFAVDDLEVHAVEWTPAAPHLDAAPLLLVHGLGASTVGWAPVGQPLADALGAPVTAIDLPGFGGTRCPDLPTDMDLHGRVLHAVLAETGPMVVVGNSMGGSVAIAVAAQDPAPFTGLVLVNPALPRPVGSFDAMARTAKFAALLAPRIATPVVQARAMRLGPERLVDVTLSAVYADPDRIDPEVRDAYVAQATERYEYPEAAPAYATSGGSLFRYLLGSIREDLARVHLPTLLIHGGQDRLVPVSFARALARRRHDWRYVEFADAGHAPQLEVPERFVDVVTRWVARDLPGRATTA